MRTVLICGGRDFDNTKMMRTEVLKLKQQGYEQIIEGGASGADSQAREAGIYFGLDVVTYWPNWERYGRAGGAIRNQKMLNEGMPHLVVAFPGGRGTADMVAKAIEFGVDVIEVSDG